MCIARAFVKRENNANSWWSIRNLSLKLTLRWKHNDRNKSSGGALIEYSHVPLVPLELVRVRTVRAKWGNETDALLEIKELCDCRAKFYFAHLLFCKEACDWVLACSPYCFFQQSHWLQCPLHSPTDWPFTDRVTSRETSRAFYVWPREIASEGEGYTNELQKCLWLVWDGFLPPHTLEEESLQRSIRTDLRQGVSHLARRMLSPFTLFIVHLLRGIVVVNGGA